MVIESRVEGISEEQFKVNDEKYESIVYRLAIIGESVNKLPDDLLEKYPQVDWPAIISMRNILIHKYYEVDMDMVWDTIMTDLKVLKKVIETIQKDS